MSLLTLLTLYAAVFGLIVGSYLNVVIYRLPRGLSTVRPRSRCPGCAAAVAPLDNIPLLSYLVLRGRCRHCRAAISARYPLVESLTGALFALCFLRFGLTLDTLGAALFCSLMVALAGIDFDHYLLPDQITLPGTVVGLALAPWLSWNHIGSALLGAAVGGGLLLILAWGWLWIRREEGMGLGDVKMLALAGAFLGWKGMLVTLFVASLLGSVVGLMLLGRRGGTLKTRLPFGVFLALGGVVALFLQRELVRLYLSSF